MDTVFRLISKSVLFMIGATSSLDYCARVQPTDKPKDEGIQAHSNPFIWNSSRPRFARSRQSH